VTAPGQRETKSSLIEWGISVKKTRVAFVAVLVVLLAGAALSIRGKADDTALPQAGQMAPNFTLPSQDGSDISLNSFRGKWVVLYFYPKDMTTGCTIEAHNFQQDMDKYQKLGAVVVGVSVDSTGSHKEFCAKEGLSFKLLSDQEDPSHHSEQVLAALNGYEKKG
jgi:peroxiredoxin Q/BCP